MEVGMDVRIDHVVLWVSDPIRSLEFYRQVVGLPSEREEEFRAGRVAFPSVRIDSTSIIDLMPRSAVGRMDAVPGMKGASGHPVNHVCLAMSEDDFEALRSRLDALGVVIPITVGNSFGAQGYAPRTFYFWDPDGNVLEARYYTE
jgi:catechol 2,3-dioxygenase-like lactoylglutathione lyase family enzyme